jgi:gas vesicle protein
MAFELHHWRIMLSRENDSTINSTLAAFVTGIGIGFGLGILFAPHSGKKTRASIAKSADRSLNQLKDKVDDLRERVEDIHSTASDLFEKGVKGVQEHKENVVRGLDHLKQAYREVAK